MLSVSRLILFLAGTTFRQLSSNNFRATFSSGEDAFLARTTFAQHFPWMEAGKDPKSEQAQSGGSLSLHEHSQWRNQAAGVTRAAERERERLSVTARAQRGSGESSSRRKEIRKRQARARGGKSSDNTAPNEDRVCRSARQHAGEGCDLSAHYRVVTRERNEISE